MYGKDCGGGGWMCMGDKSLVNAKDLLIFVWASKF